MTVIALARWVAVPIAVASVSTSGILIRFTTAEPLVTATYRMLWAGAILLAVALVAQRADLSRLNLRSLALLAASGTFLGLHFALWTSSLFHTSVASAVLLTDTHPIAVALIARVFLRELTPAATWVGIMLGLLGSGVIAAGDLSFGESALAGDAMALGASITFAGYLVIGRSVRQRLGIAAYAGIVYAVAGCLIAALALVFGSSLTTFSSHDAGLWLALVLVPTLGGHTVFNWALRYLPASVVAVSILGEPVITTALAWIVLGETPGANVFVGGCAILIGIVLALVAPPLPLLRHARTGTL